jgi:hypothetical protein
MTQTGTSRRTRFRMNRRRVVAMSKFRTSPPGHRSWPLASCSGRQLIRQPTMRSGRRSGGAVKQHTSAGSSSSGPSPSSFRQSGRYTRCHATASTSKPEGGARCVSSARRDLCRGREAILVPTAPLSQAEIFVCCLVNSISWRVSCLFSATLLLSNVSIPLPATGGADGFP